YIASGFDALQVGETGMATFRYMAADAAGATSSAEVRVLVTGKNDAPLARDADEALNQVVENAAAGTSVGLRIFADDPDSPGATVALVDDAGGRFGIDTDGTIYVRQGARLDYETAAHHSITVSVTDGILSQMRTFDIGVVNVAESLFSPSGDRIVFDDQVAGAYIGGTQYDSGDGNDVVFLPSNAAEASAAGYVLRTPFFAGAGNDTVTGGALDDTVYGGAGNDTISGGGGSDVLFGGDGDDVIDGGAGSLQMLSGGAGNDTLVFANATSSVSVDLGVAGTQVVGFGNAGVVEGIENLIGSAFADILVGDGSDNLIDGGMGDDRLFGGAGNDTLLGGAGRNTFDGGAGDDVFGGQSGFDTASYASATSGVRVGLIFGAQDTGGAGIDRMTSLFADLIGSAYGDTLTGNFGANTIMGGGGNDVIDGAGGPDTLFGGAGDDRFVFANGYGQVYVADFEAGMGGDVIDIRDTSGSFPFLRYLVVDRGFDAHILVNDHLEIVLVGVQASDIKNGDILI
ncbi:MAG: hypothetical protein ACKVSF_03270, partial [Alphaproteobacteria bacterium]